ncbi:MAG TPA: WecB/TagA/CpsF family glycosyltransferase, partial [Tepidisphaeraceae bacterium]|nr:WecB/TagA/CpsF family glycosyltransferase [Tepidisphaeraceae bacterium]
MPEGATLARPTVDSVGDSSVTRIIPAPPPIIRLLGVELHRVTEVEAIQYILDRLDAERGGVVVTPNLDHLRRCRADKSFAAFVAEAELVVADGMPLVWASRIQGTPLPERVAGSDLISSLSAAAAERGRSIFLLGGSPGTAEGAAQLLKRNHPTLRVVGTCCPPIGFESSVEEYAKLEAQLAAARPDIIFVALGSPKQEQLIERVRRVLPQAWWLGVGVSFSFLTGHVRRAPKWVQSLGIEWVHRLCQEPRRLFKRYLVQGIPFAGVLMADAATQRVRLKFSRGNTSLPSYRRPDRFIGHGLTTHASNNGNNGNNGSNGSNGNIGHVGHAAPTISDPLGRALDGIESAHASANGAMTAA